tara:strand:+ start:188 stop:481 length:294 start_codon:yes stop_codon:yes gene_type:complete
MKILKANNPEPGRIPIVVSLDILCNGKLKDNYNPDTMNGRTKRYNTYLKDSFDKEGMREPIKITSIKNTNLMKVPKGGNRCYWAKQNGYTHIEAYVI